MPAKTKEQFAEDALAVHGDRYKYDLVDYVNSTTKVLIRCAIHGLYPQTPSDHLQGCGCPKCGRESAKKKSKVQVDVIQFAADYKTMTWDELAKKYGFSKRVVKRLREELGLSKSKDLPSKDDFVDYFLSHDVEDTACHFSMSKSTVYKLANRYGVSKQPELPSRLTDQQMEIVIGSLLGDGCISKVRKNNWNAAFVETHGSKQKDYCEWKNRMLLPYSAAFDSKEVPELINKKGEVRKGKKRGRIVWDTRTYAHPCFTELERKWYLRNGKGEYVLDDKGWRIKIIPQDLILSPLALAIWYFDDGNLHVKKEQITLYTYCFSKAECEYLTSLLRDVFGLKHAKVYPNPKNKSQYEIRITRSSFIEFIDLVSPFVPCDCMNYKVDLSNYIPPSKRYIEDDVIQDIITLADQGKTYPEIEQATGVAWKTLSKIVKENSPNESQKNGLWRHNSSGVNGVIQNKNVWMAHITVQGKRFYLGSFATKKEAVKTRKQADQIVATTEESLVLSKIKLFAEDNKGGLRLSNTSGITGVSFDKSKNKWVAYTSAAKGQKRVHIGYFQSKEDAANAREQYLAARSVA